jgi:hypothetical protein
VIRFTARGNAAPYPMTDGRPVWSRPGRVGSTMLRIVVDGEGSRAVDLCIRAALGERSDDEQWLITAVKLPSRWVVSFLISPDDRLGGYTWCGPAHQVRAALEQALAAAGFAQPTGVLRPMALSCL